MADKELLPEDSREKMYGTVDPSSTRIFHFWLMKMKPARLYIYFPYGEISKKYRETFISLLKKKFSCVIFSLVSGNGMSVNKI